jgi:putative ABC transport system permease protein
MGNSLLSRSDRGMREVYIESLTGDMIIQKKTDVTMNLFGANTPIIDSFFTVPILPAYDAVSEIVSAEEGIKALTSQVSSGAFLDLCGQRFTVPLCGVDPETYFSLFEGIVLDEGRVLVSGEFGGMITLDRAETIKSITGEYPQIGSPMLLTAGSSYGFKLREVPLVGIYHYKNPGQFMNELVITDPQTVRVLQSIQVASEKTEFETSGDAAAFLDAEMDSLFDLGSDDVQASASDAFSVEALESFLGSFGSGAEVEPLVGGDWNFIIARLEDGVSPALVIDSINKKIEPYGALAVGWRLAAGQSAILLLLVQSLFNFGIFIVSVAGIIAAVNILLISLFKRTREIGTLRAIGSGDSFIRLLVMGENVVLAFIAGGFAVLCGYGAIRILNSLEYDIPNPLVASLLGGEILRLSFVPGVAGASFLVALFLGIAASVYPVEMAVRIDPVVAVRRG